MTLKNILIVDDELPARINLESVLAQHPAWHVVAVCASCSEARAVLESGARVDLILLDIHMPEQTGLEFARELCQEIGTPLIVFISAYDQHALTAFDVFALDYLLKPFDDERFARMLLRAAHKLEMHEHAEQKSSMRDFLTERRQFEMGQPVPHLQYLLIRSVGSIERINVDEALWFSSAANYVEVHLPKRIVLHRSTISALAERLSEQDFIRAHRTTLVRKTAISLLKIESDGSYCAMLFNGDKVRVSETYWGDLQNLFA